MTATKVGDATLREDRKPHRGRFQAQGGKVNESVPLNGRVYDPELGRFMSADPYIQAPYNSQSYNRYSYVVNNPLSFVDPSGFEAEETYTYCDPSCQEAIEAAKKADALNRERYNAYYHAYNQSLMFVEAYAGLMVSRAMQFGGGLFLLEDQLFIVAQSVGGVSNDPDIFNLQDRTKSSLLKLMAADRIAGGAYVLGKFRSATAISMYQRWMHGDGSPLKLSDKLFQRILQQGVQLNDRSGVIFSDASAGYRVSIRFYNGSEFAYAFGTASLYLDANLQPEGFRDDYDFNPMDEGQRPADAEWHTRAAGAVGYFFGAKDYEVYYGKYR